MEFLIGSEYSEKIIKLIDNSKTDIDILMYHWGFYGGAEDLKIQKLNLSFKSALHRGVNIRALLHSGTPSDGLFSKNRETANHLQSWGAKVKFYKRSGILHSKLLLIDKTIAVLGSHNYSKKSQSSNIEISVVIERSDLIKRLQNYFELLWGQN